MAYPSIKVTFVNPGKNILPEGAFWLSVSEFMQAAANDLDVDLEIIYSHRNHVKMVEDVEAIAAREPADRPDYLVIVNEKLKALPMLDIAQKANIKTMIIMNDISGKDLEIAGTPRQQYPHWIGSLVPNNEYAGYIMGQQLIEQALKAKGGHEKLYVAAIAGDHQTPASVQRNNGFLKAVKEYPNVENTQMVHAQWEREKAYNSARGLMKRYPKLSAIWSANDNIAFGAMDAGLEMNKKPGEDMFYVGCNWWGQAVDAVIDGEMVATVGGHFMSAGWALVMLYDYHHGVDFSTEGLQVQKNMFSSIASTNAREYKALFGNSDWDKIDFTRFSKKINAGVKRYQFDLDSILTQF